MDKSARAQLTNLSASSSKITMLLAEFVLSKPDFWATRFLT